MWPDPLLRSEMTQRHIIHLCERERHTKYVWNHAFICVQNPFMGDMTHLWETWLIHVWPSLKGEHTGDMMYSYLTRLICMKHDSSICERHTPHMCAITYSYVQNSFMSDMTRLCETRLIHVWLILQGEHTCDMIYLYVTRLICMKHDLFVWDMSHLCEAWLIHLWKILQGEHSCDIWGGYD